MNDFDTKKVLILGATGMLGHTLFAHLAERDNFDVYAAARSTAVLRDAFPQNLFERLKEGIEANNPDSIVRVVEDVKPDVVINCVGIIKQTAAAKDPMASISINSLFPHRLAHISNAAGARMIHISTDCVFDGVKGDYKEEDESNATDLYGRTKFLGEVYYPWCVTLRTSIIGHELKGGYGLVEWFLAQEGKVHGYRGAIYTGFPTVEIARIIAEYVIPNDDLRGLYQVSSDPISKYDLLKLVAEKYGKQIKIEAYEDFKLDRTLDSTRFRRTAGYTPPSWPELVDEMQRDFISASYYNKSKL